jgi:hypothetical protein
LREPIKVKLVREPLKPKKRQNYNAETKTESEPIEVIVIEDGHHKNENHLQTHQIKVTDEDNGGETNKKGVETKVNEYSISNHPKTMLSGYRYVDSCVYEVESLYFFFVIIVYFFVWLFCFLLLFGGVYVLMSASCLPLSSYLIFFFFPFVIAKCLFSNI